MRAVGIGFLLTLGFVMVAAPTGAAHQDGCALVVHEGPVQTHQICTTDPRTCASNVFVGTDVTSVYAGVACSEGNGAFDICVLKAGVGGVGHHQVCL